MPLKKKQEQTRSAAASSGSSSSSSASLIQLGIYHSCLYTPDTAASTPRTQLPIHPKTPCTPQEQLLPIHAKHSCLYTPTAAAAYTPQPQLLPVHPSCSCSWCLYTPGGAAYTPELQPHGQGLRVKRGGGGAAGPRISTYWRQVSFTLHLRCTYTPEY